MKIAVLTLAACLVATPAFTQGYDYNPFTDTWERSAPDPDEELRQKNPGAWALKHFGLEERAPSWEELNRQEYNRQAPCSLSYDYNDAAKEACWDQFGR